MNHVHNGSKVASIFKYNQNLEEGDILRGWYSGI